jgi:hypothetical protein
MDENILTEKFKRNIPYRHVEPRRSRTFFLMGFLVFLCPSLAYADAGLPLIFVTYPAMFIALIPIVLIEAMVLARVLQIKYRSGVFPSLWANLASTLAGIPLAWLCMFAVQMGMAVISLSLLHHPTVLSKIYPLSFPAWIPPTGLDGLWTIALTIGIGFIPAYFISVALEFLIIRTFFKDHNAGVVKKAVIRANLLSYGILILACLIYSVFLYVTNPHPNRRPQETLAQIPYTDWIDSDLRLYYKDPHGFLSSVKLNGKDPRVLLSKPLTEDPQFSPDGQYLLLGTRDPGKAREVMILLDTVTLQEKELFSFPVEQTLDSMGFSPAGDRVVFCLRNRDLKKEAATELDLIEISTLAVWRKDMPSLFAGSIQWSKDGNSLYIQVDPYQDIVWVYHRDTHEISTLTMTKDDFFYKLSCYRPPTVSDYTGSTDGRYALETYDWKYVLKDHVAGTELLLHNDGQGLPEEKASGYSGSFTPDDRYVIYHNLFLDPKIVFVYDLQKHKKGQIKGVSASYVIWYDPDYQRKGEKAWLKKYEDEKAWRKKYEDKKA